MKKLMIAAAIVCAAAISHGAALDWSLTGITGTEQQKAAGNVGYYMMASTWDAFSALTPDKVAQFCINAYEGKLDPEGKSLAYTATTTAGRTGTLLAGKSGDVYKSGDDVSGYVVLFDNADATAAANYANTAVFPIIVPDQGTPTFAGVFATHTDGWKSTTAVPEPTSGLLLLIGVAGLALKRRRA